MEDQIYLGDGVYAQWDGFQIKLICDCMSEPNAIYLEDRVFDKLQEFYKSKTTKVNEE